MFGQRPVPRLSDPGLFIESLCRVLERRGSAYPFSNLRRVSTDDWVEEHLASRYWFSVIFVVVLLQLEGQVFVLVSLADKFAARSVFVEAGEYLAVDAVRYA